MTDTIGRVQFIVGFDGRKLPAEARKIAKRLGKEGEAAGELYGTKAGNEAGTAFDDRLVRAARKASKNLGKEGRLAGGTYATYIEREVTSSFQKMARETSRALASKEGFDDFARRAGGASAAVQKLDENIETLAKTSVRLRQGDNDFLTSFFGKEGSWADARSALRQLGTEAVTTEEKTNKLRSTLADLDDILADTKSFKRHVEALGSIGAAYEDVSRKIDLTRPLVNNERSSRGFTRRLDNMVRGFTKLGSGADGATSKISKLGDELGEQASGNGGFGKFASKLNSLSGGNIYQFLIAFAAILAIAQPLAGLLSGVSASLVALLSSAALAAGGLAIAIAGVGAQFIWMLTHAMKAIEFMKDEFPAAAKAMDFLKQTAENDARSFAAAWGPALEDFSNRLGQLWRDDRLGEMSGRALGLITQAFTNVLESPAYKNFEKAMTVLLPASLANLGDAAAGIFSGLLNIIAAAAPMIDQITDRIGQFWDTWGKNVQAAVDDGSLVPILQKMFDSFNALLDVIEPLSAALGNVFLIGADTGNSMLKTLADLAQQFLDWTNSLEGQNALKTWFEQGETVFNALLDLVGQLGPMFADLVTPESIDNLVTMLDSLAGMVQVFMDIARVLGDLNVLGIVVEAFSALNEILHPIMEIIAPFAQIIGDILLYALQNLGTILQFLAPLFTPLIWGFRTLAMIFEALQQWFAPFQEAFSQVGQAFQDAADKVWNALAPAIQAVIDAFISLLPSPEEFATFITDTLIPAIDSLADWLINQAVPALENFADWIQTYVVPVASAMWDILWNYIIPALSSVIDWLISSAKGAWNWAKDVAKSMDWIIGPISQAITWIQNLLSYWGQALSVISQGKAVAKKVGTEAGTAIGSAAKKISDNAKKLENAITLKPPSISGGGGGGGGGGGSAKAAAKKFKGLANDIISEFTKGVLAGRDKAQAAVNSLVGSIKSAEGLSDKKESKLVAYVRSQGAALDKLWAKYEASAAKLQSAKDKLADLQQQSADMAASVSSNLSSGLDLSGFTTFTKAQTGISQFAAKMQAFAGLLSDLAKAGIPATLIQQVAALGVDAGTKVAKALLSGSSEQVKQLSADWNSIAQWSNKAGEVVAAATFDAGIAAQEGLIKGLTSDTAKLKKAAEDFAKKFAGWVKSALGIKSPSKVFQDIGSNVIDGFAKGLSDTSPILSAMSSVLSAVSSTTPTFSPSVVGTTSAAAGGGSGIVSSSGGSGRQVTIAEGAIQINAPDPWRAATETVNRVVERLG